MRYEIATLTIKLGTAAQAIAGIDGYVKADGAKGTLLGCWASEIGQLNQLYVLRGFADDAELQAERKRTFDTTNPFGCGEAIVSMELDAMRRFRSCRRSLPENSARSMRYAPTD